MKNNEIWKDVKGYECLYQVSNFGNIKRDNKILNPGKNQDGYSMVCLCKDGNQKIKLVHRLVAQAFIPNPNNYPQVNHKDENKSNNTVDNLEWCSIQYNQEYSNAKEVLQYNLKGELVRKYSSLSKAAKETGYSESMISRAARNGKMYKNFNWEYK